MGKLRVCCLLTPKGFIMFIRKLLTTLAFTVAASSASAITILYDFEQNLSDNQTSIDYVESGVTLNVTANGDQIHRAGNGMGVRGNPEGSRIASGEQLTFSFDGYRIDSFTATIWERGAEDETFIFGNSGIQTALGGANGVSLQTFTEILASGTSSFTIQGLEANGAGNRGIKIANIEVTLSEVPVPASGGLLLAALVGVGIYRRKKAI